MTPAPATTAKRLCNSDRYLPKAEEAGRQLIHSWVVYGPKKVNEWNPSDFPGILPQVAEGVLDATLTHGAQDFAGAFTHFLEAPQTIRDELAECCQGPAPQPADCKPLLAKLKVYSFERKKDHLAHRLKDVLERGGDASGILEEIAKHEASADQGETGDVFREMLVERIFDVNNPPPAPVPILCFAGSTICTPGNITAFQAGMKSGKTGLVGATIAAVIDDSGADHDNLGFSSDNYTGKAVLHIDTEQSRCDHHATITRALSRVGMESPPAWFRSFSLTDLSQANREVAIEVAIADAVAEFGGIFLIILDGVADLCRDPNNAEEAFGLVDKIHAAAIRYDCAIICVIHENPGSEKTRGHLGSQLSRKSETNLRLAKDPQSGVTTVWADYCRSAHIPKDQGLCFQWSTALGRHVSIGTAREIKSGERQQKVTQEAETVFEGADSLTYSELIKRIVAAVGIAQKTAEKRVTTYQAEGAVIKNQNGTYSQKP
jgi:hypothetical protein